MNRIVLVGRLENTPELRHTSTGIPVANFSLSVRRSIPNGQGRYERDVFRVVTWRRLAETCCRYLERGRMIAVDGKLQNRMLQSPNGDRRIIVEIHADDVRFLEGARPRVEAEEEQEHREPVAVPAAEHVAEVKASVEEVPVPTDDYAPTESVEEQDNSFFLDDDMGTPIDIDGR